MTFEEYLNTEKQMTNIEDILVMDIPLWNLVRWHFRCKFLKAPAFTVKKNISVKQILWNNHKSLSGLLKIYFSNKKFSNVFFPHPRLFFVNGKYMDRLTDPFIDYSDFNNDYIIFERHQNAIHRTPRYHGEKVIYLDFIDNLAYLLSVFFRFVIAEKYKEQIEKLCDIIQQHFKIDDISLYKKIFVKRLTRILLMRNIAGIILNKVSPKRIFLAPRLTFQHIIVWSKSHNVITYELQHGVTVGETMLYSGKYNIKIDPDYFLAFGKDNIGPYFGITVDKIINIGFPYKNYIKDLGLKSFSKDVCLVISEPGITSEITNIIVDLAKEYHHYIFHMRLHPQEAFKQEHISLIESVNNIEIVNNKIESFCAISQYSNILGENSSVMYEAMSMHKKVGRFNYGGLKVIETATVHGGFKINNKNDFFIFMNTKYSDVNDSTEIYSDFIPLKI